ncbi:Zinc finger HIT domain-containing protein 2 [Papilio xuthus]|uniref:Zinc finger HIT domain-containing protein 2 n=1 Tax=Papilio xuthus TaxID=66420 RepID=A0A194Q6H1_PAPXU|nr:Zinc finger HIT domain-containing protein 2 [Papilio xuthus]
MIDILKKVQNEDIDEEELVGNEIDESIDSDDDIEIDLHERIKDLDLNDADALWNVLTEDERNEFEAVVRGDVGSVLPQWEPWWMYKQEARLVEEVPSSGDDEHLKKCPCLKSVPKFTTITNVKPSPAISFNITNVVASYAFIMRYFNGEIDALETITHILDICQNLSSNTNFNELDTAIESVAQKCLQSELIETDEVSLEVMKHDTFLILKGPSPDNNAYYCKAALSHLLEIFDQAKSQLKTVTKENATKSEGIFSKKFPENMSYLPKLDIINLKFCFISQLAITASVCAEL